MDINQMKNPEIKEEPKEEFKWPEAFYLPTDADERKKALDRAIEEGIEPEENEIRKILWERRYQEQPGVDQFLAGWMSLLYYANVVRSNFMAKFHRKDVANTQKQLCFDIVKTYGKMGEELLYMELYHLVDFYIDICERDKKYNGIILGLGTMKTEKLIEKIAGEIYRVSYCEPAALGLSEEYELLAKAATRCYYSRFPRQRDNLEQLIEAR